MGGGIKVGKEHRQFMRVPYPDKHILTWSFMGRRIKVGRNIGSS
jgi:hypothetical protein